MHQSETAPLPELPVRAAKTYNAAADHYDHPANTFWDRFSRRTLEHLLPSRGARVLDVCCGSGAFAVPAAERVGESGDVLGIDVADALLQLARQKAAARGLANARFEQRALDTLDDLDRRFDAVACIFGVFFAADMPTAVGRLWRRVEPGGALAITTWGPQLFEPVDHVFWDAVRDARPDLWRAFQPWDRLTTPDGLRRLFDEAGLEGEVAIREEPGQHPLSSPEDWWTLVMGSGYRGTVDALTPAEREQVRLRCERYLRAHRVTAVAAPVLYSIARKPGRA